MNLQPSISTNLNDRRELFAWELTFGGHGQIPLSGAGTYYPTSSSYAFYTIDFLTNTTLVSAEFRSSISNGCTTYAGNLSGFNNFTFPAGYSWSAPLNSLTISSGTGIAYQYRIYNPELSCGADLPLW